MKSTITKLSYLWRDEESLLLNLRLNKPLRRVWAVQRLVLGFLKVKIELDFLKIETYMPSVYKASNDLSPFLLCFVVLTCYLVVSIAVGFWIFKHQDIR